MREELRKWQDLVVASAIVLVLFASRAGGQVDVSFLPGDGSGTDAALLALEKSREALLDAREAIDAALKDVDLAMVSLEAVRRGGVASSPRSERTAHHEAPRREALEDLRELGEMALAWTSALKGELARWGRALASAPGWNREEAVRPVVGGDRITAAPAVAVSSGGASEPRPASAGIVQEGPAESPRDPLPALSGAAGPLSPPDAGAPLPSEPRKPDPGPAALPGDATGRTARTAR
jgi:hypothetical protein